MSPLPLRTIDSSLVSPTCIHPVVWFLLMCILPGAASHFWWSVHLPHLHQDIVLSAYAVELFLLHVIWENQLSILL